MSRLLSPGDVVPYYNRPISYEISGNTKRTIEIDGVEYVVPDGYTLLDYIQSSGTQYIDTGYKPTSDTAVECTYYPSVNSVFMNIFGCRDATSGPSYYALISATLYRVQVNTSGNSGTSTYYGINVNGTLAESTNGTFTQNQQKVTLTLDSYNKLVKVESDEYTGTINASSKNFGDSDCSYNLYLFTRPVAGEITSANNFKGRMYSFKMWESGTLVRAMIPAKNSSNVLGMYDFVSGTFFTNAGTGTFTAGNSLPTPDMPLGVKGVGDKTSNLLNYKEIYGTSGYRNSTAETQCQCYDISVPNGTYTVSTTCPYGSGTVCTLFAMNGHFATSFNSATHGVSSKKTLTVTVTSGILSVGIRATKSASAVYPAYPTLASWEATGYTIMVNEGSTALAYIPYGYKFPLLHAQNCGMVDLGSLNWTYGGSTYNMMWATIPDKALSVTNQYLYGYTQGSSWSTLNDMEISGISTYGRIYIRNDSYGTDISVFKSLMSGKYLFYQRTTDATWTAPTISNIYDDTQLFKVGSYADTIDSDGVRTNNVGKVVFDGTETWTYDSTYSRFRIIISDVISSSAARTIPGYCTHFEILSSAEAISSVVTGQAYFGDTSSTKYMYFHASQTSVSDWTTWLATQAANGTPVTLYYPLATATTSTLTTPSITNARGVNYLQTQTELKPSELSATYRRHSKA